MDRYLVRMNESLESVKTLNKCIRTLTTWYLSYTEVYGDVLTNMESMIHYFKLVTEGYTFTLGQTYLRQESPKGELGCYIVHGQTTHPCRVSIRTPDYTNLQAVHVLSTDHYVADLIATLGTADIVLGSVDKILRKVLSFYFIMEPWLLNAAVYSFNCSSRNTTPVPRAWDKLCIVLDFTPILIHS